MRRPIHHLPLQLTSFIGREQDKATIEQLIVQNRLLTLTGPGGCGKTRLALEVAATLGEQGHFDAGIWLVELAPLVDAGLVAQTMAAALGVRPMSNHSVLDSLVSYLQSRTSLLLLDNCEHLIASCARLVETLLQRCPSLSILATSREALRCAGEVVWSVPALALPHENAVTALQLDSVASIRLFVARAAALRPGFAVTNDNAEAIARICRRLDGMPLALELAAARIKTLPVAQLAARLDNALSLLTGGGRTAAPRQQTLHATIAWSYGLLSHQEQILLRQLSIFSGDFSLDAAEAIIGQSRDALQSPTQDPMASSGHTTSRHPTEELTGALFNLVEKSLLQLQDGDGDGQYRMLETIRQFAQSLLSEEEDLTLGAAHSRYYLHVVERVEPHLYQADRQPGMKQLTQAHSNLRAVLRRESAAGHLENALRMGGALWWFWWHRGYWSEGRDWLESLLAAADQNLAGQNMPGYARARLGAGVLAWAQTDYTMARNHLDQCLQRRSGLDAVSAGYALLFYSATFLGLNELVPARTWAEESLAHWQTTGHQAGYYLALSNAGIVALFQQDIQQATIWLEEAIAGLRRIGDRWALALPLRNLGYIAYLQGEYERAAALQRQSLSVLRGLSDERWFASRCLELLAETTAQLSAYRRAATLFGASEALREAIGASLVPYYQAEYDRCLQRTREGLDPSVFQEAWNRGRSMVTGKWERLIQFALEEDTVAEQAPPTPRLRIFGFGPTEVYREGTLLTNADWTYAKPRELLFYLLCSGATSKETIGLALWPDASPEQLRRSFHTTLHRLRQALGDADWLIFAQNRYGFNHTLPYWFDTDACATGIQQAQQLVATDQEQAIQQLGAAIALCRGEFLADILAEWTIPFREQWVQRYQAALLTVGSWLYSAARWEEAIEAYRQAIAQDPLLEAAHRGVMHCLVRQGESGLAIRHYQSFAQQLQDELGVEPSPETVALATQVMKGAAA